MLEIIAVATLAAAAATEADEALAAIGTAADNDEFFNAFDEFFEAVDLAADYAAEAEALAAAAA